MLKINLPEVVDEVTAVFKLYENALVNNDVRVLDTLFWDSPHTVRFGVAENLYGYGAIKAFRSSRPAVGLGRMNLRSGVTTYGSDFATTHIEFLREGQHRLGRQSQVWMRTPQGWRVVAAHVSLMD